MSPQARPSRDTRAGAAATLPLLALFALQGARLGSLELPSMQAKASFDAGKAHYYRFEMVDFSFDGRGAPFSPAEYPALEARIKFDGKEVQGLTGREHAVLLWDENRQ